jgi:molybdate transport system substrate-binding protein
MNRPGRIAAFLLSLAVFIGLAVKLFRAPDAPEEEPILVYCAAGLRIPVEAALKAYGGKVQLQFGGSNTLLANAEVSGKGDLFIAADDSYLKLAREKGLAAESIPLARQSPVLAVAKGNPKKILAFADLQRADVKVVQANPEATAVGKLVRGRLEKAGQWAALKDRTVVF